jgi:hypothetical protein
MFLLLLFDCLFIREVLLTPANLLSRTGRITVGASFTGCSTVVYSVIVDVFTAAVVTVIFDVIDVFVDIVVVIFDVIDVFVDIVAVIFNVIDVFVAVILGVLAVFLDVTLISVAVSFTVNITYRTDVHVSINVLVIDATITIIVKGGDDYVVQVVNSIILFVCCCGYHHGIGG